jgi:hypothetical protein
MRTIIGPAAVALLLAAGCGRAPQSPPIVTANSEFHGYKWEFEYPEGTKRGFQGNREVIGAGAVNEDIAVYCGDQSVRIVNGKLTLNGADRGTVNQADTIKLTSTGKLWVNQELRE